MAIGSYTVQIRQRGVLTIPTELRREYGLGDEDVLTLVDLDGTLLLHPRLSVVPKLAREIEKKRKKAGVTVEELIKGVHEDRSAGYDAPNADELKRD